MPDPNTLSDFINQLSKPTGQSRRYREGLIHYTPEGWINATILAFFFRKRLDHYFVNLETRTYLAGLCLLAGVTDPSYFVKASKGRYGGT